MLESLKSDNLVDNKNISIIENTPSTMQRPLMIRTRQLTKVFGHFQVLRGIDLELRQGEFLTLLGPNGAGKTTLLRILATLAKPTSGEIELAGIPLTHAKAFGKTHVRRNRTSRYSSHSRQG
jgi:ABC-type Fe3+/spermidine/putrescine transport system ATPase subunit